MSDRLLRNGNLPEGTLHDIPHHLLTIQHRTGLLVLLHKVLNLVHQLSIHLLIFCYQSQHLVNLEVQVLVLLERCEVLLSELLLLTNEHIQIALLSLDGSLNSCNLLLDLPTLVILTSQGHVILVKLVFGFGSLLLQVLVAETQIGNIVVNLLKFLFSPLAIFILVLQLTHEFVVVLFGLVQSLLEPGISRLSVPNILLKVLQLSHICIKEVGQVITFVLNSLSLLLQSLDVQGQGLVLIVTSLILVLNVLDLVPEILDLSRPAITLALEVGVTSQQFLDQHVGLLQLHPQVIDLPPQLDDRLLVDVRLDPE